MVRPVAGDQNRSASLIGRTAELDLLVSTVDRHGQALVTGEPGIGKTSLLAACAGELEDRGLRVVRATSAAALTEYPFASISHLLGDGVGIGTSGVGSPSPSALSRRVIDALLGLAPGSSALLVLDDVHHLDRWSAHAVLAARAAGGPRLLAAARSTSSLADAVTSIGRAPGMRVELQRLARAETAELATRVLGSPLDTPSVERVHAATDGLPLAVAELLDHAKRSGVLAQRSGLWRWLPSAPIDRHLAELLGLRLDELDTAEREVVEILALVDRLPMVIVDAISAAAVDLVALEERRLVTEATRPGWLTPAHPLLRDASLAGLEPVRRRRLLERVLAELEHPDDDAPVRSDRELVRLRVRLAVELDADVPFELLTGVVAHGRAHGLWELTAPVMRRAWEVAPGPDTGLAYGEALYWTRRRTEAAEIFDATIPLCRDPVDLVRVTLARGRTLDVGNGDREAAEAARAEMLERTDDPSLRLEIVAAEADEKLFLGEIDAIVRIWSDHPVPSVDHPDAAARYRLTQSTVGALGLAGRLGDMTHEYEFHRSAEPVHGEQHPLAAVTVGPWWAANNVLGGRPALVEEYLVRQYREAVGLGDPLAGPIWALPSAIGRWVAGDLIGAEHLAREALGIDPGVVSIRRIAAHFLARVLELQGRHAEAMRLCDEVAVADDVEMVHDWGIGIAAVARRHVDRTAGIGRVPREEVVRIVAAADRMAARGQVVAAAHVFHDLLRLGAVDEAGAGLAALSDRTDATVVEWMSDHARGRSGADPVLLRDVAEAALADGHVTLARQTSIDAHEIAVARRDGSLAHRLRAVVAELTEMGSGWPDAPREFGVDLGLSARELEVAKAAALGLTDRQVAATLDVSVRTVNAHLRSVYRKLGINDRLALPGLFDGRTERAGRQATG